MIYRVDFHDMIDGWCLKRIKHAPGCDFDDLQKAIRYARDKQSLLRKENIAAGEHYGVINLETGKEVFCLKGQTIERQPGPRLCPSCSSEMVLTIDKEKDESLTTLYHIYKCPKCGHVEDRTVQ